MSETWLILGASSSVARAFARAVAETGAAILLAGRDRDDLTRTAGDLRVRGAAAAQVLDFDARDLAGHAELARRCDAVEGVLNVFLAFGTMPGQEEIDRDPSLIPGVIESNYTGAVSVLARLAPLLEARGAGKVVVLGSVAGDRGRLKNYVYGSAKAGLHAYLQGLRARLCRKGVTVTTVKPGFMDTAMTWNVPGMFLVASPDRAARAMLRHALKGREVAYVPGFWRLIMTIITAIPERVFKKLSI